ncbi:MAG: hypothetical protein PHI68_05355 [Candidatus Cloacimonetes bacterium]|nr:hypothetical protein [Candidatus Cloacimonadota bacterium]
MKKILLIALVALMLLSAISFVGCGKKAEEVAPEEAAPVEEVATPEVPDTTATQPEAPAAQ